MFRHILNYSEFSKLNENVSQASKIFNIQKEFDLLNKEMFNGTLKPIPLKWVHRKDVTGMVHMKLQSDGYTYKIEYLALSAYYVKSYNAYRNTMAHELIHVYMFQNNIPDLGGYHGETFQKYMRQFNKKGFNITIQSTNDDVIGIEAKRGEITVVSTLILRHLYKPNENDRMTFMSLLPSVAYKEWDHIINEEQEFQANISNWSIDIYHVECSLPNYFKYKAAKNLKYGMTLDLTKEEFEKIIKNSKVINQVTVTPER